jgi:hypothetical protein
MVVVSYVPNTRSQMGLPPKSQRHIDYEEYLGDTPIYTMFKLLRQQLLGFPVYLLSNASGQKDYPRWTNHFNRAYSIKALSKVVGAYPA